MKTYNFYLNAETLILTKDFYSLKEADLYCKENYSNYWNIEILKKTN